MNNRNSLKLFIGLALIAFALHFSSSLNGQSSRSDIVGVYYLGGQSNMECYGFNKDLPVELSKTTKLVQYAQEKFARSDASAAIVRSTRYYKYSDTWHYDSEGYLDLGKRFAEALYQLTEAH